MAKAAPRVAAERKSQLRKKKKRQKKLQEKAKKNPSLREAFALFHDEQKTKLRALASTIKTVWNNQRELHYALKRVDAQFSVLARLTVINLNELKLRIEGPEDYEPITYEHVNALFDEWDLFVSRPDFREHMRVWMMGGDLGSLPEVPKKNMDEPGAALPEENGAKVFGGDYEKSASDLGDQGSTEEPSTSEVGHEETEVPSGQDGDDPSHYPAGGERLSLP